VRALADAHDATPGQVALAWLLVQQPWIVPIPVTRRVERIAETPQPPNSPSPPTTS